MGRPITREIKLRDGFYIEVKGKGVLKGIKIRRDTLAEIQQAIRQYKTAYTVNYIGEIKDGKTLPNKPVKVAEEPKKARVKQKAK